MLHVKRDTYTQSSSLSAGDVTLPEPEPRVTAAPETRFYVKGSKKCEFKSNVSVKQQQCSYWD